MVRTIEKKRKVSQTQMAYNQIQDMILHGKMSSEDIVSIASLSEALGIGRSPVNAACQHLEYDGLLRVIPKQGIMVKTLGIDEARQVYEARSSIECFFAGKIYLNMKEEDTAYLRSLLEKQKECMQRQDNYGFTRENMAFHQYPMTKYDNSIMEENYNRIIKRINLISIQNSSQRHRMEDSITEHQAIIEGFEKKDLGKIVQAIETHIMNGYLNLTKMYQ